MAQAAHEVSHPPLAEITAGGRVRINAAPMLSLNDAEILLNDLAAICATAGVLAGTRPPT